MIATAPERVRDVHFTEDSLAVNVAGGRTIIVPVTWYPGCLKPFAALLPRFKQRIYAGSRVGGPPPHKPKT